MKSESIVEITKALIDFQGNLKPVPRESTNPYFKSKYASLHTIWEHIRKPLRDNGLAVTQLSHYQDGQVLLTTTLLHTSGEWLSGDLLVTPGKQNDAQSMGSALTYARRYALSAILGICSEEDDDAESTMVRGTKKTEKKPNPVVEAAKEMGAVESIKNAGEFLTKALNELKLNKSDVEKITGPISKLTDFEGSWVFLKNNLEQ